MIERLRIEELALVDRLELEFGAGLNVLTGETGAGKSIILSALGLLAGGRASSDAVREGADQAVVEALFDTSCHPELEQDLRERGLLGDEDEHALIVRRTVSRAGRSRAWVGGNLVPLGTLGELFEGHLEVSSQHASQALLRTDVQTQLLDAFGGTVERRRRVEEAVRGIRERDAELARLQADADERARREDYLRFQVQEIDEAGLDAEQLRGIEEEHRRLVHAERLQGDASLAAQALGGDPSDPGARSATDGVADAARRIEALAELDPSLAALAERLAALRVDVDDCFADLDRYAAGIDVDPARLPELEERLAQFERLRRKYGTSVDEILGFREEAAAELQGLAGSDDRMQKLAAERAAELERLTKEVRALTRGRKKAAAALAAAATDAIRGLSLPEATLDVALEPVSTDGELPAGPSGAEQASLEFSANPGEAARALKKVASGGELSRVFLALKNVLRQASAGMVLVFDEVDAGIGGAVADRVGAVLSELADQHQVLCITHLPQIGARGGHHFRVAKGQEDGRTVTRVAPLDAKGRENEIARMAGGEEITAATRRHAKELLAAARKRQG